jgi:hypothetical protein
MSAAAAAPPQSLVEKVSNAITKLQEAAAPYMKVRAWGDGWFIAALRFAQRR